MNILYIGSSGALSLLPFKKLLTTAHSVVAVRVLNPPVFQQKVFALENESLALSATRHEIPLLDLSQPIAQVLQQCERKTIDLILMSCFSKRLPAALIGLAKYGCFNLHPSLLPAYRGPEPVFWQMKAGVPLGVSWHQVVEDFDAGAVLCQQAVIPADGATYADINLQLAQTGVELLTGLLAGLPANASQQQVSGIEQDPALARYYPYPQPNDFVLDTQCSAQQAYNFMRATQVFSFPYYCQLKNRRYLLVEALAYDMKASRDSVDVQGDILYIPFKEGVLSARYTDKIRPH